MRDQGLGSWLHRRARTCAERPAWSGDGPDGQRFTYAEAAARCDRLAHGLRSLGVERGDRVAYLGPNHPSFLETLFATAALGAVFVPLNFRLTTSELAHLVEDSGTRVLVAADGFADADLAVETVVDPVRYAALVSGPVQAAEQGPVDEPVSLDDPAVILYTSGTTGRPKGAVLTHGNLTWNSVNVLLDVDIRVDEKALVYTPLFHSAALGMVSLPVLLRGGELALCSAFDPETVLRRISDEGVTLMFGVPATYDAVAARPEFAGADLSRMRTLLCGGAPVPASTIRTWLARDLVFLQGYGMTEASPGVLLLDAAHAQSKAGSAGVPHFFTDVRVAGPDGASVSPGDRGEVLVAGPHVMDGYWQRPEATAEVLDGEGWFHSGDVATVDDDGYVRIVDRIKDMIISGGENVYPAEVESAIHDFPGVAECAVVGMPDERWGEVGRAVVVPSPGAEVDPEALLAFLRERLAGYKVPRSVVFSGALPRTPSGKIRKRDVAASQRST
ncbi:fatty-acyl-CoA synthase [Pseudonocardia sediminis]|uniref:Fatty-acyl-CoA synthase n=1 Tax=Pseudonocardia sediminis TaxID=1397368 RepID=A0A4Q7UXL6_PSEST|nr:long-chain fatty acid--CoA ligase [Pseudonocardia sediminis]RZT86525.1 fatty-acyl-CoA synthase [Pseudonocardia sediminis]